MMAADTLCSYGSLARYKDVRRLQQVGTSTLIGASGIYSITTITPYITNLLLFTIIKVS